MITIDEARTRVEKGAAHLDQVRPNWFNQIDIGTLTLSDPCWCIVGQLCDEVAFMRAVRRLGDSTGSGIALGFNLEEPGFHVFVLEHADASRSECLRQWYQPLQDAWVEAICDRRMKAATADRGEACAPTAQETR